MLAAETESRRHWPGWLIWSAAFIFCAGSGDAELDISKLPPPANRPVDFAKDIQPILAEHCYRCHGPDKQENGLRWDMKSVALKGGLSGPAIVTGKSAESRMIHLVAGLGNDPGKAQPGERPK